MLSVDFTHVKCHGQDRIVAVATAVLTGQSLTFELLDSESALHAERWIRGIAQLLGAEVLVTDDANGLKNVAEALGVEQPICRAHVNRNVADLIAALGTQALEHLDWMDSHTRAWLRSKPADSRLRQPSLHNHAPILSIDRIGRRTDKTFRFAQSASADVLRQI